MYDIVPDIHGQAEKLTARLTALGYRETRGAWRHPEPARRAVFLGDFIDRGPRNGEVIAIVRAMQEADSGLAIMGNHELNAIHYHMDAEGGGGLRERSEKNTKQHRMFLEEFPLGSTRAREAIGWMQSLPVFLDLPDFRAVHACWDEERIMALKALTGSGVLSEEQFREAAVKKSAMWELVDPTTKGPEYVIGNGWSFTDKDGHERAEVRIRWWVQGAETWPELAASVPDPSVLPAGMPPADLLTRTYPVDAKPVFFGHYWLTGAPVLQAPNALCLDYSAGLDGPLLSYRFEPGDRALSLGRVSGH